MALGIMALGIMALGIMTLGIMTHVQARNRAFHTPHEVPLHKKNVASFDS